MSDSLFLNIFVIV